MSEKRSSSFNKRKLSLALVLCGMALLVFGNVATDYAHAIFAPDGIYIPQSAHRFAASEAKGGMFSHTFRIYNLRPRRLSVQAEPDCGCTGVSWQSAVIPPLGWRDLTAKMEADASDASKVRSVGIGVRTDSRIRPMLFMFLNG